MLTRSVLALFGLLLVVITINSCKHQPIADQVCFETEILPILSTSCASRGNDVCHSSPFGQEGVTLDSYDAVKSSSVIVSNNPEFSRLYRAITGRGEEPMPPRGDLPQEQIDLIKRWIQEGAKDIPCDNNFCDTSSYLFNADVWPIISKKCTGCHSGNAPEGGIMLTSYTEIKLVVDDSLLPTVLTRSDKPMPPSGSLDQCSVTVISNWVKSGAAND